MTVSCYCSRRSQDKNIDSGGYLANNLDVNYFTESEGGPISQEIASCLGASGLDRRSYDMVLNYSTVLSGLSCSKAIRAPMVYDLADDIPALLRDHPGMPRLLSQLGGGVGEFALRTSIHSSVAVTTVSKSLADRYRTRGVNFHIVPNGVDTDLFRRLDVDRSAVLDLNKDFIIGYAGALREWIDLLPILRVLARHDEMGLVLVGSGSARGRLEAQVEAAGLRDSVDFVGPVRQIDLPKYLSAFDCGIIPFDSSETSQNSMPLKALEYLACGLPVVSSRIISLEEELHDYVVFAQSEEEWENGLLTLLRGGSISSSMKEARRRIKDEFDWARIGDRMARILEESC